MVGSMCVKRNITKSFWTEVVNWNVHILIKSAILTVKDIRSKPFIGHFKVFSYLTYAHILYEKRHKLNDRLFYLITNRLIVSSDVLFDEENPPEWNEIEQQQDSVIHDEEVE